MSEESKPEVPQEVVEYVQVYAPELDPADVAAFMAEHPKPDAEPNSHVAWATQILRQLGENQHGDGISVDRVADEMRRRER